MSEDSATRARAAAFYESALRPADACCGSKRNAFIEAAGYTNDEVKGLPADAAANSFGCGNPLAFSGVRAGDTVLDLGCGAGIDLLIASQRVGPKGRVIGVDVSDVMLDRARANVARSGAGNIELRQGAVEALPVADGSVDWVISNCVINLSSDKAQVFREIRRVLKPGGRVLVSDIVAEGLPDWIMADAALHDACLTGAISEREYLASVRAAGLTDVTAVDRFTYDDAQLRALTGELLPAVLSSLSASRGEAKHSVLDDIIAAIGGRVHSLRISALRAA